MSKNLRNRILENIELLVKDTAMVEGVATDIRTIRTIIIAPDNINVQLSPTGLTVVKCLIDVYKLVAGEIDYMEFTYDTILRINKKVRSNYETGGALRTCKAIIHGSSYVPPVVTRENVLSNLTRILEIKHPFVRAREVHKFIAKTQMFDDGNKRTSIVAANYILLKELNMYYGISESNAEEFKNILI